MARRKIAFSPKRTTWMAMLFKVWKAIVKIILIALLIFLTDFALANVSIIVGTSITHTLMWNLIIYGLDFAFISYTIFTILSFGFNPNPSASA